MSAGNLYTVLLSLNSWYLLVHCNHRATNRK